MSLLSSALRALSSRSLRRRRSSELRKRSPRSFMKQALNLETLEDRLVLTTVNLGALEFSSSSLINLGNNNYSATGTIDIGFKNQPFVPVITIEGSVAFTTETDDPQFTVSNGTIETSLSGNVVVLGSGMQMQPIDVQKLITVGEPIAAGGTTITVASGPFTPTTLRLLNSDKGPEIQLQGDVFLSPEGIEPALDANVSGDNFVTIDSSGASLNGFSASITGTFEVFGVTIAPQNLTVAYSNAQGHDNFTLFGGVSVTTEDGVNMNASLGDSSDPGLLIADGVVQNVNIGVSGSFPLFGVTIMPGGEDGSNPFTFQYSKDRSEYDIYGDLSVEVDSSTFTANLGDSDSPGLKIVNGVVKDANIAISGDFDLFGLQIDATNAGIDYQGDEHTFKIFGQISVPELFDATVGLGSDSEHPGITITDGHFVLDQIKISLSDIDFGAFTLETVEVSYTKTTSSSALPQDANDFLLSVTVEVEFPEGWAVGGTVSFVNGKVDEISINYHLGAGEGVAEGIEIGDTGLTLTEMTATVQNIDQPANLVVSGSLAVEFGAQVSLLGEQVTIFRAFGSFTVDKDELDLSADVWLGALNTDPDASTPNSNGDFGNWSGVMGAGSAQIDLNWADGIYSATLGATMYDGTFTINAGLTFDNSGDLVINAEAAVHVPHGVPFIGDRTLGSLNFLFDYHADDSPPDGFVAAWVELDIGHKFDIGIEYDMTDASKEFKVIGTGEVENLLNSVPTVPAKQTFVYSAQVDVAPGTTSATFTVTWPVTGGSDTVSVLVPDGTGTPIDQSQFSSVNGLSLVPQLSANNSYTVHLVGSTSDSRASLLPGSYILYLTNVTTAGQYSVEPTFVWSAEFTKPTLDAPLLSAQNSNKIPVTISGIVNTSLASQTKVSLYLDTKQSGYHGVRLPGAIDTQIDSQGNLTASALVDVSNLTTSPYYVYASIDDGTNAVVYSDYSDAFTPEEEVSGTVNNALTNTGLSGIRLILNLGDQNTVPSGFLFPGTAVTAANGSYSFSGLTEGVEYNIRADIPKGFQIHPNTPDSYTFTYASTGGDLNFAFQFDELTVVSGTVYKDLNANGRQDQNEPGIPGLKVHLKSIDTPSTLASSTLTTTTNTQGGYAFYTPAPGKYGITVDDSVLTSLAFTQTQPTLPYKVTVDGTDFQVLAHNDFGEVQPVTISGNVSGYVLNNGRLAGSTVPLGGWTINLVLPGGANTVVATTTTANDGSYAFIVQAGNYMIQEVVPAQWREISPFDAPFVLGQQTDLTIAQSSTSEASGDFDGDGNLDIAMIDPNGTHGEMVSIYYGNGDGTFSGDGVPIDFDSGVSQPFGAGTIVAEDYDGDGMTDLVVSAVDNTGGSTILPVYFLRNNGKSAGRQDQFQAPLKAFSLPGSASDVVTGDFNNDGRTDLAYTYAGVNGGFALISGGIAIPKPVTLPNAGSLAVGDVNNDGYLDLVVIGGVQGPGAITVAYGNVTGIFTLDQQGDVLGGAPASVALADLNGDGYLDMVLGAQSSGQVVVFAGTPTGFDFTDGAALTVPGSSPGTPLKVVATDLNGDLIPDVAVVPAVPNGMVSVFLGKGGSGFHFGDPSTFALNDTATPFPAFLATADFTNDGLPDLVATDNNFTGAVILVNDTSTVPAQIPVAALASGQTISGQDFVNSQVGQVSGVVFQDTNRNGRQDAGDRGRPGVSVYLDINENGILDPGEPTQVTNANGAYAFTGLPDADYYVRLVPQAGKIQTAPSSESEMPSPNWGQPAVPIDLGVADAFLQPIAPQSLQAGSPFSFIAALTPAATAGSLRFSLLSGAPAGAEIDATTGLFTWTPTATQSGKISITVRVADARIPTLTETQTFTLSVLPITTNSANVSWLHELYHDLLGRDADPAGVNAWLALLQLGAGRNTVTAGFVNSTEHRGRQVDTLYATYLNRTPAAEERSHWISALDGGVSDSEAALDFVNSAEYQNSHLGIDSYLSGIYQDVLGRTPDAAGLAAWETANTQGFSRSAIAQAFLTSDEAMQSVVTKDYTDFLDRTPEAGGLSFWLAALKGGNSAEGVAASILASDEYFAGA